MSNSECRDEWICGDGPPNIEGKRREYIIHTYSPRFIARVVMVGLDGLPLPSESEADVISGITYTYDVNILCEFQWIDPPPPQADLEVLLVAAQEFLEEIYLSED